MSSSGGHQQRETLRAIEALASGAAHHLNNFLAVVVGHLQLALMKTDSADVRGHLAVAERAAQDGAEVVRRLSRFTSAHLAPRVQLDLNQVAAEVLSSLVPRATHGAAVDTSLEAGAIPPVAADATLMREVLSNLVLNAIEAMPEGGRIAIRTWADAGSVYCAVSDTGTGMAPDVQRRALEPFFTTKGLTSTGLGLSVNYGILRGYGGDLAIESMEGRGTTATFYLPAASPADLAPVVAGAPGHHGL
jgi:signal transduction histidine kinase